VANSCRPQSAEQVHSWLARHLSDRPHPPVKRPINWLRGIAVTTTILGTVTFISVAWPYLLPIIQNRNVWAAVSLIAILLFTSGHMFNHIRKVPYVAGDGRGGVSYFAGGFSNQFGLETQIVAAMCKSSLAILKCYANLVQMAYFLLLRSPLRLKFHASQTRGRNKLLLLCGEASSSLCTASCSASLESRMEDTLSGFPLSHRHLTVLRAAKSRQRDMGINLHLQLRFSVSYRG
jgi:hypothetical protein